jgi:hypothetical protein
MSASITISSGILRHAVYRNGDAIRLLVHIMLMIAEEEAAHTGTEEREAGVLVRSMYELGLTLRWSRSKTVRTAEALRKADAIKTRAVPSGTEIKCLYYSRPEAPRKERPAAARRKPAPEPKKTPEERAARFAEACSAVIELDPARLPEALRKEFYAYWTEQNESGVLRFEKQPFFDHARRMDTWRRNAESKGFSAGPSEPRKSGIWNPRA